MRAVGCEWDVERFDYYNACWIGGYAYNYGLGEANYPVPALYYGKDNPQWYDFRRIFDARYAPRVKKVYA